MLALTSTAVQDEASTPSAMDTPAPDAALRAVPLERVFPYWTAYLDLDTDQRDAFELRYVFSGPEHWSLWLQHSNGSLRRLGGWPDQVIAPPARSHFDQGAILQVETADAGGMSVNMTMVPTAPLSHSYDAAALEAAMSQAQRAMRSIAGAASIFAPRLDTITFVFEGPAPEAVAVLASGERIDLPVEGSIVRYPARQRQFRNTVRLEFGSAPEQAQITPR